MIPILYEKDEAAFTTNGLGRLRDTIEARVTEERNGIYELSFSYPLTGAHFNEIQVGRIVAVTHDETGDLEPFDIVSYSKPINGVVEFHCVHISYRLSYMTVTASSINSLADAFTAFESAEPSMPFSFQTDKTSTGYAAAFNGLPQSVRSLMGGIEGSLLDTYGGEYAFNNWTVYLYAQRGQQRDFSIRYGVNMLDYNEDVDSQGAFSSCMPYWTDGTDTVLGDRVDSGASTITGRGECVPLDLSDKFETQPTKAQVEAEALSYMTSNNTFASKQTISVDFVRLQDMGYEDLGALMECKLCDSINVIFPDYNTSGWFKIVRTEWDVLADRYVTMELGSLSVSLSEALGIENSLGGDSSGGTIAPADYIVEQGTNNSWNYRKWNNGTFEAWRKYQATGLTLTTLSAGTYYGGAATVALPDFSLTEVFAFGKEMSLQSSGVWLYQIQPGSQNIALHFRAHASSSNANCGTQLFVIGTWR